jgi:hypothetical protein
MLLSSTLSKLVWNSALATAAAPKASLFLVWSLPLKHQGCFRKSVGRRFKLYDYEIKHTKIVCLFAFTG